jgi:hypothetical protein
MKQATNLLMKCNHDFRLMVAELLEVKHGRISLRNMVQDTFNPVKGPTKVYINQNSSKLLQQANPRSC